MLMLNYQAHLLRISSSSSWPIMTPTDWDNCLKEQSREPLVANLLGLHQSPRHCSKDPPVKEKHQYLLSSSGLPQLQHHSLLTLLRKQGPVCAIPLHQLLVHSIQLCQP